MRDADVLDYATGRALHQHMQAQQWTPYHYAMSPEDMGAFFRMSHVANFAQEASVNQKDLKILTAMLEQCIKDELNDKSKQERSGLDRFMDKLEQGDENIGKFSKQEREYFTKQLSGEYYELKKSLHENHGVGKSVAAKTGMAFKAVGRFCGALLGAALLITGLAIKAVGLAVQAASLNITNMLPIFSYAGNSKDLSDRKNLIEGLGEGLASVGMIITGASIDPLTDVGEKREQIKELMNRAINPPGLYEAPIANKIRENMKKFLETEKGQEDKPKAQDNKHTRGRNNSGPSL